MKKSPNNIKEELAQLGVDLEHKPGMPLGVPDSYFATAKAELLDNIEALGFVDSLPKEMPQTMPINYFQTAKDSIIANITALELLETLPKEMPQALPADYFQTSKNEIIGNIAAIDLLESLPKGMPQALPAGYFVQSKSEILDKVSENETTTPLTVTRRSQKQNWTLAATMALLVSLGLFFLNPNTQTTSIEDSLSKISSEMIDDYIEDNAYDFEALDILENPQSSTAKLHDIEQQILNEAKTMSDEEIFEHVL